MRVGPKKFPSAVDIEDARPAFHSGMTVTASHRIRVVA